MEKICKIILASNNKNKLREFKEIFNDVEVVSASSLGYNEEVIEDGLTFYENALKKAKTASDFLKLPVVADDSGLCVKALNFRPGIYSARYAGTGIDLDNCKKVLNEMKDIEDREAYFVSTLVMCFPDGKIIHVEGKSEGKITKDIEGENGFGYDPIFYSNVLKKAYGKCSSDEKNSVSHRHNAIVELSIKLKKEGFL